MKTNVRTIFVVLNLLLGVSAAGDNGTIFLKNGGKIYGSIEIKRSFWGRIDLKCNDSSYNLSNIDSIRMYTDTYRIFKNDIVEPSIRGKILFYDKLKVLHPPAFIELHPHGISNGTQADAQTAKDFDRYAGSADIEAPFSFSFPEENNKTIYEIGSCGHKALGEKFKSNEMAYKNYRTFVNKQKIGRPLLVTGLIIVPAGIATMVSQQEPSPGAIITVSGLAMAIAGVLISGNANDYLLNAITNYNGE